MTNSGRRCATQRWVVMGAVAALAGWGATAAPVRAQAGGGAARDHAAGVARGKYLVDAMGCHDCHTPAKTGDNGLEPDMTRALTGHPAGLTLPPPPAASGPWIASTTDTFTAWAGPWGISYARNLTPDAETGLGTWTEQQFVDTIRTGRRQGRGREILPPMPWPMYRNLDDADLKAIYAYLQSLSPVRNAVPEPVLPPPSPTAP